MSTTPTDVLVQEGPDGEAVQVASPVMQALSPRGAMTSSPGSRPVGDCAAGPVVGHVAAETDDLTAYANMDSFEKQLSRMLEDWTNRCSGIRGSV